ncbi:MAG: hypothetical protein ACK5DG_02090, partial [Chitinophagaceae bacterium]
FQSVTTIERKLLRIIQLNYLLTPDILPVFEKAKQTFEKVNIEDEHRNSNLAISKNDLMFLFWLHQTGSLDNAINGYIESGLSQASTIKKILIQENLKLNNVKFLDFASGHGRVSRYFKNFLPVENIIVSDIKSNAIEFQKDVFGYGGFTAPSDPKYLSCEDKFDFILVSSLFTHLNEDLFARWLVALGNLLNENGILAVSIHKIPRNEIIFQYSENSEDDLFPETTENLSGKKIYGLTHLSISKFNEILNVNLPFKYEIVCEHDWAGSQVLLCIKKCLSSGS